jgi:hypothetical protein
VVQLNSVPHEFAIGGVYLPPMLVAAVLAVLATVVTARLLNKYRLSKYFFYPPAVLLSMVIIYTVLIGTFVIRG